MCEIRPYMCSAQHLALCLVNKIYFNYQILYNVQLTKWHRVPLFNCLSWKFCFSQLENNLLSISQKVKCLCLQGIKTPLHYDGMSDSPSTGPGLSRYCWAFRVRVKLTSLYVCLQTSPVCIWLGCRICYPCWLRMYSRPSFCLPVTDEVNVGRVYWGCALYIQGCRNIGSSFPSRL